MKNGRHFQMVNLIKGEKVASMEPGLRVKPDKIKGRDEYEGVNVLNAMGEMVGMNGKPGIPANENPPPRVT